MTSKMIRALSAEELRVVNGGCSNCMMADLFKGLGGLYDDINDICHTDMGKNFPKPNIVPPIM